MKMEYLAAGYPWIKALHVAAVMSWMAGMFYLPRLFVYHVEQAKIGSDMDRTFQTMERKLLRFIMRPAMLVSWACGIVMIAMGGFDWSAGWSWIKLGCVIGMTAMHIWLGLRVADFARGENRLTGRQYRMANEVPTVLMLVIVVAVIVRPF